MLFSVYQPNIALSPHQYFCHGAPSPSFASYNIQMQKSCLKYHFLSILTFDKLQHFFTFLNNSSHAVLLSLWYPSNMFLTCLELFLIFLRCDRNFRPQLSLTNPHCAASADGDKPYRGFIQENLSISNYNTHVIKGNHE